MPAAFNSCRLFVLFYFWCETILSWRNFFFHMYEIRPIDPHDDKLMDAVARLQMEVFPISVTKDSLRNNTLSRNGTTLYLGAFDGNELAAFNAFIGYSMHYNEQTIIAHQSCWTATAMSHRGKGLFQLLINSAKDFLKQQGSGFIFGFPNVNSYPIFTQKLGFREMPLRRAFIPTAAFSRLLINRSVIMFPKNKLFDFRNCYLPYDAELIELKKNQSGDIKVFGADNNIVWGKILVKQVKGIAINYFSVGGITVNKPNLLREVFYEIIKRAKANYIEIVGMENNTAMNFFRYKYAASKTEPLIIFDLNHDTSSSNFNFYIGIKDVY